MGRLTVALTALVVVLVAAPAVAYDGVDLNRTAYHAIGLSGHPDLEAGGVVDVTFGRGLGALELHRVTGAAPHTTYQVAGEVFFGSACDADDPFGSVLVPEGAFTTDSAGNGRLAIRFPGEAFATAPDVFWVRWHLSAAGEVAYRSGCVTVELGP